MKMIAAYTAWMDERKQAFFKDLGLLLLRLGVAPMMAFGHGLGKLQNFEAVSKKFPDLLGLGSPKLNLALAIGGEFFFPLLIVIGLGTRLAATQAIAVMAVAAFMVHWNDPLFHTGTGGSKEFALLYLVPFLCLFIAGPGRFSLDRLIVNKFGKSAA